jgi:GTP-binding protein Era
MIKKIGESARKDIEKLIGGKVFLKLFVKVLSDWRDNTQVLEELGYDKDNL